MSLFKSKATKEMERDIEFRRGVQKVKSFIKKNQNIRKRYWTAGKKALQMDDQERFARYAKGYLLCGQQIRRWEKYRLDLEMLEVRKDQAKTSNSFLKSLKAVSKSTLAQSAPGDLAKLQVEMDRALARGESLEESLAVVMEMSGESVFALHESPDEDALLDVQAAMTGELGAEAMDPADRRIEEGLKKLEEEMKSELR
jgi:hypothetical protein